MRYLLDTCTFIWFVTDSPELSLTAKNIIEDENNKILLSLISIWEMALKNSIGKLVFSETFNLFIDTQLSINEIEVLTLSIEHIYRLSILPFHHKDPFDRLIIAQTMVEDIPVISADPVFNKYPIINIW